MNIQLTDSAKEQILKQNTENKDVRIYVSSMGWAGPSFSLSLDEAKETDQVIEIEGIKFVVEEFIVKGFGSLKVDYGKMMFKKGYIITPERGGGGSCS